MNVQLSFILYPNGNGNEANTKMTKIVFKNVY